MAEEWLERLKGAIHERMKYAPLSKPHRFSVPVNERTMTIKVADLQRLINAYEERGRELEIYEEMTVWMPRPPHEAYEGGNDIMTELFARLNKETPNG